MRFYLLRYKIGDTTYEYESKSMTYIEGRIESYLTVLKTDSALFELEVIEKEVKQ